MISVRAAVTLSTMLVLAYAIILHAQINEHSALKDLSISSGTTCNNPNPPGVIKYLNNANASKVIVGSLRKIRVPTQGQAEVEILEYTLRPKSRVELGCTREGSGAPIIVDISWEIQSARYK